MHLELLSHIADQPTKVAVPIAGFTLISFFAKFIFIFLLIEPTPSMLIWTQFISALLAIIIGFVTIIRWLIKYRCDLKNKA